MILGVCLDDLDDTGQLLARHGCDEINLVFEQGRPRSSD
jgi:hypothetical protein